jgi:diguanylate cyclase (GGDEF)-like protein
VRAIIGHLHRGLFGLQFRTTVLLTLVVLATAGLTGASYLRLSSHVVLAQSKRQARDMAKTLAKAAAGAIEDRDRATLLAIAEAIVPDTDLSYLLFTDMAGELLASRQQGAGNITHLMLEDGRRVSVDPINRPRLSFQGDLGPRIDVVYPVEATTISAVGADGPRPIVGYVRLGVSMEASSIGLAVLARNVVGLAVGITLLMVPVGYEVVRNLVGPLRQIGEAARAFSIGKLDARVPLKRRDEIGELAGAFNGMADNLAGSHNRLIKLNTELEDRVLQRTEALGEANKRLQETASRDSLTGLYNRRHFNELLERLFAESSRYQTDLTCMMIDLDNFKRVNDSLGHHAGDLLLKMTAEVLLACIRESDLAVRYGGDEFVVLLPRTSPGDARASAKRILDVFTKTLTERMPEASIVSLSIGLASREEDRPPEPMHLVQLADEALYLAKAGGKNRITVVRAVAAGGHRVTPG